MKRLTELLPFLAPLRAWQREKKYNLKMLHDNNKYALCFSPDLKYKVAVEKSEMINQNSGHPIIYQENKVHNLKIISKTMSGIVILPGETFSFCLLASHARKYGKYKDGLVLVGNKIVPQKGGGVCQLSNLLYLLFLKTPLTIVERHGHKVKGLPDSDKEALQGVDATVYGGVLDLKVRNDTDNIYQIKIDFDNEHIIGTILSNNESLYDYKILNEKLCYINENDKIYESVSIVRLKQNKKTKEIKKENLYEERVQITYDLPEEIEIKEI